MQSGVKQGKGKNTIEDAEEGTHFKYGEYKENHTTKIILNC